MVNTSYNQSTTHFTTFLFFCFSIPFVNLYYEFFFSLCFSITEAVCKLLVILLCSETLTKVFSFYNKYIFFLFYKIYQLKSSHFTGYCIGVFIIKTNFTVSFYLVFYLNNNYNVKSSLYWIQFHGI